MCVCVFVCAIVYAKPEEHFVPFGIIVDTVVMQKGTDSVCVRVFVCVCVHIFIRVLVL